MTNYIYKCEVCGLQKDVRHSILESPEIKCPNCNETMYRKIGNVGVNWKAGGETR